MKSLPVILLISCIFASCGGNIQKGKYAVMSYTSSSLVNDRGALLQVNGVKTEELKKDNIEKVPLFYVLAVLPKDKFTGFGSSNDNKTYNSFFDMWWYKKDSPGTEAFRMKVDYDRENDKVKIFDNTFNREEGNTYLVKFDSKMDYKISRFGTILETNEEKIINYFKTQTADDPDMKDVLLNH